MDASALRVATTGAGREIGRRMARLWRWKLAGMTGGMAGFFAAYFWVLRHPQGPVQTMPVTAVDGWIAFQPEWLAVYGSLWIYVSLLPALQKTPGELADYAVRAISLSAVGLGIFVVWPTAVPVREIDWTQHAGFAWLKQIDATGNACPSLHVAFAVFSAIGIGRVWREIGAGGVMRGANRVWCAAIVYSTVAIGQHVVLDLVAGAALGAAAAVRISPRTAQKPESDGGREITSEQKEQDRRTTG